MDPTRRAAEPEIDLWAAVGLDHLPTGLRRAFDSQDWPAVRLELQAVMDGVITDGAYGRELLQLVRQLPIGLEPVFDRYRAMASIDFGDWDSVERCLAAAPNDPIEIRGMRDVILAPVGETRIPACTEPQHRFLFDPHNCQLAQLTGGLKRWARRVAGFRPVHLWARGDIAMGRHVRFRQVHDAYWTAVGEALSGRLSVAVALAGDAQHLGDEGEPLRTISADLEELSAAAMGEPPPTSLRIWGTILGTTGSSPLAVWQWMNSLLPLMVAADRTSAERAVELLDHTATGLGSPRAHLHALSWQAALEATPGGGGPRELRAALAQVRDAGPGLKVLPLLVRAMVAQDVQGFFEAERMARQVTNVWAQISALTWATALAREPRSGRRLTRLLRISGWRRPVLAPPEIAARAAEALAELGFRGDEVIELASVAGLQDPTVRVARLHLDDPSVPTRVRRHALEVIASSAHGGALDLLRKVAAGHDDLALSASELLPKHTRPFGLSEREHEVLVLAGEGLKNREIATRLVLSPHTIARHLANARAKLGAANRTEAASRLRSYQNDARA